MIIAASPTPAQTTGPSTLPGAVEILLLIVGGIASLLAWRWLRARRSWAPNAPKASPAVMLIASIGLFLVAPLTASILAPITASPMPAYALAMVAALAIAAWHGARPNIEGLRTGILAALVILPIVLAVSILATTIARLIGTDVGPVGHDSLETIVRGGREAAALIAIAVLAAPVIEEVTYRLLLHGALRPLVGDGFRGALATALLAGVGFGLIHASVVPVHMLAPLIALGIMLGLLREGCRGEGHPGLTAAIVVHLAFNALNVVLAMAR